MYHIKNCRSNRNCKVFPLVCLSFLLILRLPFLFLVYFKIIPLSMNLSNIIFNNCTYLLTIMLIIYEKNNLSKFNITFTSLLIIIFIPITEFFMELFMNHDTLFNNFYLMSLIKPSIAIILFVLLIIRKVPIEKLKPKHIIIWFFISIATAILVTLVTADLTLFINIRTFKFTHLINLIIIQMNYAAINEEPLFRGFICGYLSELGWNKWVILIVQAILFMISHLYYVDVFPLVVVFRTFLGGIVLGLIVMGSRSISSSIITHSVINSLGQLFESLM